MECQLSNCQVQAMEELFNSSEGFRPIAVRCAPRSGVYVQNAVVVNENCGLKCCKHNCPDFLEL